MCSYIVNLHIDPEYAHQIAGEKLSRAVQAVLQRHEQPTTSEVTLVLTSDRGIQELNKQFRGIDRPTDVLAFSAREGPAFIVPEGLTNYLGDIIISYPTAAAQAEEQGHPIEEELLLLTVHGCLHLLGYDHQSDEEQARMWAVQEQILSELLNRN